MTTGGDADLARDRAELLRWIAELAVVHGRVVLSSGREADHYVDLRRITLHHAAAPLVGRLLLALLDDRDIAADAVWRRLVTDPLSGALLDHGRTNYRPPAALADFVRGRDVVCRRPGCRRAAATCELDHVVPWNPDGTTDEDNLCTLCTADHDLKEQPGWQVVLHGDRRVEWITPTGHRYWTEPHDYRTG